MTLSPASGAHLEQILRESHELWSEGLSPSAYARYWEAQIRTPWGAAHLDRVALVEEDRVISSAKRYDLSARFDGRIRRVLGIGAVFTSPSKRGRGGARELLHRLLDAAVAEGYEFAALFSEIDPAFYERFDFVPVPLVESRISVRPRAGTPAILVRAGDERDLAAVADMSARRSAGARLALDRTEDLIRFGLARRRLLAGLGPPGLRQVEFLVAEEGHTAVAYVVCSQQEGRWFIEDAGDRDPAGARLGAILQTMLSRTPAEAAPEIRSWWPHDLAPPQLEITERTPTAEVLMIRPMKDRTLPLPPLRAEDVAYWRLDYF
jgi:predicted N-acetyltransferase YhbS